MVEGVVTVGRTHITLNTSQQYYQPQRNIDYQMILQRNIVFSIIHLLIVNVSFIVPSFAIKLPTKLLSETSTFRNPGIPVNCFVM